MHQPRQHQIGRSTSSALSSRGLTALHPRAGSHRSHRRVRRYRPGRGRPRCPSPPLFSHVSLIPVSRSCYFSFKQAGRPWSHGVCPRTGGSFPSSAAVKPFVAMKTHAPSLLRVLRGNHADLVSAASPRATCRPSAMHILARLSHPRLKSELPPLGEWVPCLLMWRISSFPAGARPRQPSDPDLLNERLRRVCLLLCW
ncbi:hypothetical protein ZWY2020_041012 [Hordeum vulgare]|nr:hypothetical protein ZWY2020_041012 [Hordeum vulgare]